MCIDYCYTVDLQIKAMEQTTKLMTCQCCRGSEEAHVSSAYIPTIPLCISFHEPQEMADDWDMLSNLGHKS